MDPASDFLDEGATLLPHSNGVSITPARRPYGYRLLIHTGLVLIVLVTVTLFLCAGLPSDPLKAAEAILSRAPIIDGHVDLPWLVRSAYRNNATAVELSKQMLGQVDIPRLRKGRVGGFFWSVYTPCTSDTDQDPGLDFLKPTSSVRYVIVDDPAFGKYMRYASKVLIERRDTLEQIDISHQLIHKYSDTFELALTADDVIGAVRRGKISALIGIEGGHQLGNSLGALRQFAALGVRYVTLTHTCHNVFADSCGLFDGLEPLHHGLSPFGKTLVRELNRLGVLVDLSHTSDDTALAALRISRAPVIWSHSSARALHDIPRNVPDEVLRFVGTGVGQRDGVVMVNFFPRFVSADPDSADVKTVADHVDHIANVTGRTHVGIGSDYDGIESCPIGLEDVSTYPVLIAELYSRGWSADELRGFAWGNFLRVFAAAEDVAREMAREGIAPAQDLYEKRTDIPKWH